MFNVFKAQLMIKNHETKVRKERNDKQWIKKYRMQTQPSLVSKHERRITGFAKKMQCEPVVLSEGNKQQSYQKSKYNQSKLAQTTTTLRMNLKLPLKTRAFSQIKLRQKTMLLQQNYENPRASYRERNRKREINPPMKYGNVLSKQYLQNVVKQNRRKKQQEQRNKNSLLISRKQSQSNENHSIDQLIDINHSDFDDFLQIKARQYAKQLQLQKAERQIKEQEQLKALSHDRLYFKSLVHFREKTKDALIQQTLDDVLAKCRVVKKSRDKVARASTEKDLFAQIMKLSVGRTND